MSVRRDRALSDLWFFQTEYMRLDLEEKPHREMTEIVQYAVEHDERPNVARIVPRGTYKSTMMRGEIVWQQLRQIFLYRNFYHRILLVSAELALMREAVASIAYQLEHNPRITTDFGELYRAPGFHKRNSRVLQGDGIVLAPRLDAGEIATVLEPNIFIGSLVRTNTGWHADGAGIDDLHSDKHVQTPERREKAKRAFALIWPVINPEDRNGKPSRMIVNATRWHDDDVPGMLMARIEERSREDPTYRDRWTILQRSDCTDPTLEEGELYFPSKHTRQYLREKLDDLGPYLFSCNPAGSPVLMSDWTEKPIEQVKVGDEVVGFEVGDSKKPSKLVKSTVLAIGHRIAKVVKIRMASGKEIRCTPDHQWYQGRRNTKGHRVYHPLKAGYKIPYVINPAYKVHTSLAAWNRWSYLSGLIDGEGSVIYGSVFIAQSPEKNPEVCQAIERCLDDLQIEYRCGDKTAGVNGTVTRQWWLKGGRQTKIDLLRYGCMAKAPILAENIWNHPEKPWGGYDRVVSIEPDWDDMVFSFQTTTGNYICWGYPSKNCNYLNDPIGQQGFTNEEQIKFVPKASFPPLSHIRALLDPNQHTKAQVLGCWSAIVVVGFDRFFNLYIHDARGSRSWDSRELVDALFDLDSDYRSNGLCPNGLQILIENEHMAHFENAIRYKEELEALKNGNHNRLRVMWVPVPRDRSYEDRWMVLQPRFRRGQIFFAEEIDPRIKREIQSELIRGRASKYVDFLDALAMAEIGLRPKVEKSDAPRVASAAVSAQGAGPNMMFSDYLPADMVRKLVQSGKKEKPN